MPYMDFDKEIPLRVWILDRSEHALHEDVIESLPDKNYKHLKWLKIRLSSYFHHNNGFDISFYSGAAGAWVHSQNFSLDRPPSIRRWSSHILLTREKTDKLMSPRGGMSDEQLAKVRLETGIKDADVFILNDGFSRYPAGSLVARGHTFLEAARVPHAFQIQYTIDM